MGLFFIYILKASVCLALFYLFYKVLLSKETFHRFNRLALLGKEQKPRKRFPGSDGKKQW